jgi:hypothetical protein
VGDERSKHRDGNSLQRREASAAGSHLAEAHTRLPNVVSELAFAIRANVCDHAALLNDLAGHGLHHCADGLLAQLRLGQSKQLIERHDADVGLKTDGCCVSVILISMKVCRHA